MRSVTVNEDLSSHVVSEDGTQEFFLPTYNPITLIPFATEAQVEEFAHTFARSHPNAWMPFVSAEDRAQERIDIVTADNRSKRDALIAATDWWASSDLTMTDEQTAYRQALRDITAHEDWPELADADWPVSP